MRISDWSSDVCSSDLGAAELQIFNACQCVDAFVTAQGRHGNHAVAVTDRVVADCQAVDGSIIARPTLQRVVAATAGQRSEERRVGKECVSTCSYRWSSSH